MNLCCERYPSMSSKKYLLFMVQFLQIRIFQNSCCPLQTILNFTAMQTQVYFQLQLGNLIQVPIHQLKSKQSFIKKIKKKRSVSQTETLSSLKLSHQKTVQEIIQIFTLDFCVVVSVGKGDPFIIKETHKPNIKINRL